MNISPSYPLYAAGTSCFAKCFSKTVSTPTENPLHHHNYNYAKRALRPNHVPEKLATTQHATSHSTVYKYTM
jgi:hypothetical protein